MTESEIVAEVFGAFAGLWFVVGGGAILGASVSLWTHPIAVEWRAARRFERAEKARAGRG